MEINEMLLMFILGLELLISDWSILIITFCFILFIFKNLVYFSALWQSTSTNVTRDSKKTCDIDVT